jgi:hypothetical protein
MNSEFNWELYKLKLRIRYYINHIWLKVVIILYCLIDLNVDCIRNKHTYIYSHKFGKATYVQCIRCGHVIRESEIKR